MRAYEQAGVLLPDGHFWRLVIPVFPACCHFTRAAQSLPRPSYHSHPRLRAGCVPKWYHVLFMEIVSTFAHIHLLSLHSLSTGSLPPLWLPPVRTLARVLRASGRWPGADKGARIGENAEIVRFRPPIRRRASSGGWTTRPLVSLFHAFLKRTIAVSAWPNSSSSWVILPGHISGRGVAASVLVP